MGVYIYLLTTKSRKFKTENGTIEVFHARHWMRNDARWAPNQGATIHRMEKVWERRGNPEYVIMGSFGDGAPVYTKWPKGYVVMSDSSEMNQLHLAGYLRADGSKLRFEPWPGFETDMEERAIRENLDRLNIPDYSISTGRFSDRNYVAVRTDAQVVAAKLACYEAR